MELMRLPLVITAISNTQAAYLLSLWSADRSFNGGASLSLLAMSIGLYSFGMVMNDIVDNRRDLYLHPNRPLVSGRFSMQEAYLLAAALLIVGFGGGMCFAVGFGGGLMSLFFLVWTLLLIFFYNLMGKFVGAVGILTLGLTRFFHASIAQSHLPVVWHPLVLLDHVAILSAICYYLEGKRPRLSRVHWIASAAGLIGLNLFLAGSVVIVGWFKVDDVADLPERIGLTSGLLWPAIAVGVFAALVGALLLSLRETQGLSHRDLLERQRTIGRKLMFFGLLWLIIYDIAFACGYRR
jgi:4-hydroxybenzoate polyprenyltransferase